jgi:hypothetical protein
MLGILRENLFFVYRLSQIHQISVQPGSSPALKRFYALERKFKTDSNFKTQYQNFMQEYISLNHMLLVEDDNPNDGCYLPHQGIIKFTGTQTKFRVVFDGSAKSSNGTALNDHLLVGPNLQKDIFSLLVHFRQYQYALSADVVKMFRQIWISQKHWKYQKVLWRSDPSEPLSTYYLHTVTYGTASAPYLAMKCLQQLTHEFAEKFPHASKVLLENMYMDDILTGTNTLEDAITLRDNLINVLDKGGFALAK